MLVENIHRKNKISIECKLFVWSIVLEPLLFFKMSDGLYTGINITLARIVQLIFLITFICNKFIAKKSKFYIPDFSGKYYLFFTVYFCLIVLSSFMGGIFYDSYELKKVYGDGAFLQNAYTFRVFVEFIVLLYYFFYFVVFPKYILSSRLEILYLLKWIERTFYFCLFLGFVDLIFAYFRIGCIPGSGFIPRHLVDTPSWVGVGVRFHGIAGEPRDAFPYLIFCFLIIQIKNKLLGHKSSWIILPMVILTLLSTQSGSGVVGIALGVAIFTIFTLFNFNLTKFHPSQLKAILAIIFTLGLTVYSISETERLHRYYIEFSSGYNILSSGGELPILVVMQSSNVFPLWLTLQRVINFELFPLLFGSGMGSSAIANSNFGNFGNAIPNAHAQISRTVFESGFVGLWLYILFFYTPFKILLKRVPEVNPHYFYVVFFMLLGACLGHRSTAIFVFTGIVISICHVWFQQSVHMTPPSNCCEQK